MLQNIHHNQACALIKVTGDLHVLNLLCSVLCLFAQLITPFSGNSSSWFPYPSTAPFSCLLCCFPLPLMAKLGQPRAPSSALLPICCHPGSWLSHFYFQLRPVSLTPDSSMYLSDSCHLTLNTSKTEFAAVAPQPPCSLSLLLFLPMALSPHQNNSSTKAGIPGLIYNCILTAEYSA